MFNGQQVILIFALFITIYAILSSLKFSMYQTLRLILVFKTYIHLIVVDCEIKCAWKIWIFAPGRLVYQ